MPTSSLRYRFRQAFRVPAKDAFTWCTDFVPEDRRLLRPNVRRSVRRISSDALILTDQRTVAGRRQRISRLVRIDPGSMSWTNTHLNGPFVHSQYWYRIVPDGPRRSHLEFEGFRLLHHERTFSPREVDRLAEQEQRSDAQLWRDTLAPALERDLRPAPRR